MASEFSREFFSANRIVKADLQVVVIPQFGFDLIAKLVIDAGFMVNLLNHDLLPVRHLRQVRIPAFALAQQFEQKVGIAIYQNCFRHKSTLLVG